jgi:non-canonical (house-cleaning) NTP pyrophosphatase
LFCGLAIMPSDLKEFWHRFQSGVEVAVDGTSSDRLLGVRDGFLRFFHDGLERPVPVAVVPQEGERGPLLGLATSDEEAIARARARAARLRDRLQSTYHFYVASEGGLHSVELDGRLHYFVRTWTTLLGAVGEAWGASGAVELPEQLVDGLAGDHLGPSVPGTRRSGGLIASLTGGLENRRSSVALSTLHALSSFFYGRLEPRAVRKR